MKKVCLLCDRSSPDSNLFCQESYCPAEQSPYIFDSGEWLGDIEIIRLVSVLRASALYAARQGGREMLLKIAHPGPQHTDRLKREATLLRDLAGKSATLPTLLPPYINTTIAKDPYGRARLGEHLLYFCLLAPFDGESLRDVLIKHPQLWAYHVGWLMTALASAVAVLQSKNVYHYGLSPEAVLVRFTEDRAAAPQVLLFDLGIASDRHTLTANWYPTLVGPAYTAPEFIDTTPQPNYATDVYGLGLILYELLVGQPAFPFKLRGDRDVRAAVQRGQRVPMSRVEDVKDVADLAVAAVASVPAQRPASAADFAETLLNIFGPPPTARRWLRRT